MTDCTNGEMRDLLPELLHDGLAVGQRASVEAHVEHCPVCADELALLRRAGAAMRHAPAVDVARITAALPRPTGVRPELRLVGGAPPPARVRRAGTWRPMAAAASLLLVAGATAVGVRHVIDRRSELASEVARAAAAAGSTQGTPDATPVPTTVGEVPPAPAAPSGAGEPTPVAAALPDMDGVATSALLATSVASMSDAQVEQLLAELDELDASLSEEPRSLLPVPSPDGGGER
ncbi:MAG TPA: zf-HC2 domain-containing protein [Gemmatimonadaceae bacterium]|nr:zf-HC2 domain-containing protein [Gemmatimonadaceae bacterium]